MVACCVQRGNLTFLLCGEKGLVQCMEQVFQYGFRSSRLFRNKMFIWDYLGESLDFFKTYSILFNNSVCWALTICFCLLLI
jgi:hypothetical protein